MVAAASVSQYEASRLLRQAQYAEAVTLADDAAPKKSSAWNWPAEWAVERAFWREVGTRTISGMLTLIFLGAPVVFYAIWQGTLTPDQGWPILIAAGLWLLVGIVYVVLLAIIRGVSRRRARTVLRAGGGEEYTSVSTRDIDVILATFADGKTISIPYTINRKTSESLSHIQRSQAIWSVLAAVVAIIGAVVGIISVIPIFQQ